MFLPCQFCTKEYITIELPNNYFTSSLGRRYRKVKLCGIHSMLFADFARWNFLTLFLRDSGRECWIISITSAWHKPESLENESTILGRSIFWSLRMPKVALMYSSFATSSSWNTLFGVYMRTCHKLIMLTTDIKWKSNAYMRTETSTAGSEWFPEQSAKCRRGSGCSIAYACRPSPALNFIFEEKNTRNHYKRKQVKRRSQLNTLYIEWTFQLYYSIYGTVTHSFYLLFIGEGSRLFVQPVQDETFDTRV